MARVSGSGALVRRPAKKKTGTESTRKHRFESFSTRVAKINIDPVRRGKAYSHIEEREDGRSHFCAALEDWKDKNMSMNFTDFVQRVDPLCQSLPQILHHEVQIAELLVDFIEKADALSLEPLLSLTAQFARDLGSRFESHFEKTVAAVSRLAQSHGDVEVVEWSFNCVTWLFKYLSRLLVSDLRPVYNLMAPLLGKHRQKLHVTRFAAEAMSFLVRKAAVQYQKNNLPLTIIVIHAIEDLANVSNDRREPYKDGVAMLFSYSIKGIQRNLNSYGKVILTCLFSKVIHKTPQDTDQLLHMQDVIRRVLIDVIHHTDASGFAPALSAFLEETSTCSGDSSKLFVSTPLIFTIIATRKATRIEDWPGLLDAIKNYINAVNQVEQSVKPSIIRSLFDVIAISLHYAPFGLAMTFGQDILREVEGKRWEPEFLGFCSFIAEIDSERFNAFVMPTLKKFIGARWEKYEAQLCYILPKLADSSTTASSELKLHDNWQDKILRTFRMLNESSVRADDHLILFCNRYIDVVGSLHCASGFYDSLASEIHATIESVLRNSDGENGTIGIFALNKLLLLASKTLTYEKFLRDLQPGVFRAAQRQQQRPMYFHAILSLMKRSGQAQDHTQLAETGLMDVLIENLASPSHELRDLSLNILRLVYGDSNEDISGLLDLALKLESSPFSHDSSREDSRKVRLLGSSFHPAALDEWMQKAIPAYCFGLLHVRLAPLWEDVCNVLQSMCSTRHIEDSIVARTISWLHSTSSSATTEQIQAQQENTAGDFNELSKFQCVNLARMQQLSNRCRIDERSAMEGLRREYSLSIHASQTSSAMNRSQALRIFQKMPSIAEKRSRVLVPILLGWISQPDMTSAIPCDQESLEQSLEDDPQTQQTLLSDWSRKDQKSLLSLFSQFNNPSVLYRSQDVYSALCELLCNGDVDIQKSALSAIFTWKSPAILPYKENLQNLLDDTRFRDEVTVFLDVEEESGIREQHREVLKPVLLRLLYGRAVAKSGVGGSRGTQESRRRAVLTSLSRFGEGTIEYFVKIAIGSLRNLERVDLTEDVTPERFLTDRPLPYRNLIAMLKMLYDVLEILGGQAASSQKAITVAVLHCLVRVAPTSTTASQDDLEGSMSLLKSVRHEAFVCLNKLFVLWPESDLTKAAKGPLFEQIILPRLGNLPIETAQGISIVLRLFSTWTASINTIELLLGPNPDLLKTVADCLVVSSAKLEVKLFVLREIINKVVDSGNSFECTQLAESLQSGLGEIFLDRITTMLQLHGTKESLEASIQTTIKLKPFLTTFAGIQSLFNTCLRILDDPIRIVNHKIKGEIVELMQHLLNSPGLEIGDVIYTKLYTLVSKLFSFFRDSSSRIRLVALFKSLTAHKPALAETATFVEMLNSYSANKLDEPDFDARDSAFQVINSSQGPLWNAEQWLPLIHNLLFLVKDNDELATRSGASIGLQNFVRAVHRHPDNNKPLKEIVDASLIPALQKGMREQSELVRLEYVSILAKLVEIRWPSLADLHCLVGPDEESSFFANILHIQPHRRLRALRRLSQDAEKLSSESISRICIPLIENYFSAGEDDDANLANEAVNTLDSLSANLAWPHFRAMLQNMMQDPSRFSSKLQIRALGAVVNGIYRAERDTHKSGVVTLRTLSTTLPDPPTLSKILSTSILPKILDQIHYRDESSIDTRILLAVIAVKLVLVLPPNETYTRLPVILTDICNILKSRSQEARDSARKVLSEISSIIGPSYFGFVIKQLRSSLKRGYQLHVLSFTVHSILVSISSSFEPGSIDYCLQDLMPVIMDDTLGLTGQEKEATGYISSMREVKKKAQGFDSMEVLASLTTPAHLSALLKPIQLQFERPKPKTEKLDELLSRIREGVRRNTSVGNREILVFCYEILNQATQNNSDVATGTSGPKKMATFSLDLLRRVLDKHEELKSAENVAGFLPLIKLSMEIDDEEVRKSAFRMLAAIIKLPLQELDDNASTYIRMAKRSIENSSSTTTDVSQAALRLASAVLRERSAAVIGKAYFENDVAFMLDRIKPDLQEPSHQGERDRQIAAFNFLKAMMARGVIIKEMYEVMDVVREIMITSQERPIPELARSVYSRFVLDYFPENGKGFAKQLDFLTTNLQYDHPRGRKSVMEVLGFLLSRKASELVQPMLTSLFLPLSLLSVVDDSDDCRQNAQLLLQEVFERSDRERTKLFKSQLVKWLNPETDILWKRGSLCAWRLYFNVNKTATSDASTVYQRILDIMTTEDQTEKSAELLRCALELLHGLCELFPGITFAAEASETFSVISSLALSEYQQIQAASAKLINCYLTDFARNTARLRGSAVLHLPLIGSGGLELNGQGLLSIMEASMHILSSANEANQHSATEVPIQILSFIGRVSSVSGTAEEHVNDHETGGHEVLESLFDRTSAILRIETDTKFPPHSKVAALKLLSSLVKLVPPNRILRSLQDILLPLQHLGDTEINAPTSSHPDFERVFEEMRTKAQEVTGEVREKVGVEEFVVAMRRVQRTVSARREGRKVKRAVDAVNDPEKVGREKRRKNEKEQRRRRAKSAVHAGRRRGW